MEYMYESHTGGQISGGFMTAGFAFCASKEKLRALFKKGRSYLIPCNAVTPADGRTLRHKAVSEQSLLLFSRIGNIKEQFRSASPTYGR